MQRGTGAVLIAAAALLRSRPRGAIHDSNQTILRAAYLAACGAQLPLLCPLSQEVSRIRVLRQIRRARPAFRRRLKECDAGRPRHPAVEQSCGVAGLSSLADDHHDASG